MPKGKITIYQLVDGQGNVVKEGLSSELSEYIFATHNYYTTPYMVRQAADKNFNLCRMFKVVPTEKVYTKICSVCGKEYPTEFIRSNYCSPECKESRQNERIVKGVYTKKKKEKLDDSNISKVNAMAKKMGMSYGQYVALQYMQGVR